MIVNRSSLAVSFADLGLRRGDALVVHSSLRCLGIVDGGAKAVVGALTDVIGPDGLLVLPTFTDCIQVFDPATTPSSVGRIPEAGRTWLGAVRSWHPTHSVVAIGQGAATLCAEHHLVGAMAVDSPLDRLAARGGYALLVGVGHNRNSTIHVGESHAGVPYLDIAFSPDSPRVATILTPSGTLEVTLKDPAGCSKAFGAVEKVLRDHAWVRDGIVGRALVQLMTCDAVIKATVEILHINPSGLLCTDPHCYRCVQSRQRLVGDVEVR